MCSMIKDVVNVTAIVLCFSVHVRASGVGNKESAQEIVNEYFSLIGNDWDKFAELYTNEQINCSYNYNQYFFITFITILHYTYPPKVFYLKQINFLRNKIYTYSNNTLYICQHYIVILCIDF